MSLLLCLDSITRMFNYKGSIKHLEKLLEAQKLKFSLPDSLDFAKNLASYGRAKSNNEVSLFYDLLTDLSDRKYRTILYLEKRAVLRDIAKKGRIEKIKKLPCARRFKDTFRDLIRKGRKKTAAAMLIMITSGRRHADLCRIKRSCFQVEGHGKYMMLIPRDKSNTNIIAFRADLKNLPSDWLPSSKNSFHLWLTNFINNSSEDYPFKENLSSNTARNFNFQLHSLRSIAAIQHKVSGKTDEEIMELIGWTDSKMLDRYCKVCITGEMPRSLSKAVEKINSFIDKIYKN